MIAAPVNEIQVGRNISRYAMLSTGRCLQPKKEDKFSFIIDLTQIEMLCCEISIFFQVIYWKTATVIDVEQAYSIVYDGEAWSGR